MNVKTTSAEGWFRSLLGLWPFLFWLVMLAVTAGLGLFLGNSRVLSETLMGGVPSDVAFIFIICWLSLIGITAVGGASGWPSWTFSNLSVLLLVSYFISDLARVEGSLLFAWLAWIPPLLTLLIILLTVRSFSPLGGFVRTVSRDWTRVAFGVYAAVPFAMGSGGFSGSGFGMVAILLLLSLGAWGYLRTPRPLWRFLWLAVGFSLVWVIAGTPFIALEYGRQIPGASFSAYRESQLIKYFTIGLKIQAVLCLPGVLAALAVALHRLAAWAGIKI